MKDINLLTSNGIDVKSSLELFGDMNMYDATLEDFLNGVDEKINYLKEYKETGDAKNYAIYAHSLKSDARYLGFTKLQELALDHELKGKENDVYYIVNHFDELINETKRIISLVKSYLGTDQVKQSATTIGNSTGSKKILVADDSDIIRNFVKQIFGDTYEVITTDNGEKAIEIVEQEKGSLGCLLLDLNMPGLNGFEVLEYFKTHDLFKIVPVSIITGEENIESIERAKTYDIVDILFKPFNPKNIKIIVEKTIK